VRTDANHAEQKPFGWKVDLPSVLKKGEEKEADDDEEDNDDPDLEALRFRKRWNRIWSRRCGCFDDTSKFSILSASIYILIRLSFFFECM
jgi:hypothetical protein